MENEYTSVKNKKKSLIMHIINSDRIENLPPFGDRSKLTLSGSALNNLQPISQKKNADLMPTPSQDRNAVGKTSGQPTSSSKLLSQATSSAIQSLGVNNNDGGIDDNLVRRIETLRIKGMLDVEKLTPSLRFAHEKEMLIQNAVRQLDEEEPGYVAPIPKPFGAGRTCTLDGLVFPKKAEEGLSPGKDVRISEVISQGRPPMDRSGMQRDNIKKLLQSSPRMMPGPRSTRRPDSDFNKNLSALDRLTQSM